MFDEGALARLHCISSIVNPDKLMKSLLRLLTKAKKVIISQYDLSASDVNFYLSFEGGKY